MYHWMSSAVAAAAAGVVVGAAVATAFSRSLGASARYPSSDPAPTAISMQAAIPDRRCRCGRGVSVTRDPGCVDVVCPDGQGPP